MHGAAPVAEPPASAERLVAHAGRVRSAAEGNGRNSGAEVVPKGKRPEPRRTGKRPDRLDPMVKIGLRPPG
ncbi:hypothetical protein Apa02nite_088260 [Actinoplanes palleronii]|uniref:Uncharacterized protein n=1 Tax=Actinoplanes palleronii TaxID=113570 RepID=A0ABQ4BPY0_9ACTN|nr:hypothetical protein Apa02nite_088260 [Actinoplanes palleronii]